MVFSRRWLTLLLLLPLFVCSGCFGEFGTWSENRQVRLYPVSGTVTLDGEPVEGAQVIFQPEDAAQQALMAIAETDASGRFKLATVQADEGAVAGPHRVRISKTVVTNVNTNGNPEGNLPPVQEKDLLPVVYKAFETSGLKAQVSDQEPTVVKFELSSQSKK